MCFVMYCCITQWECLPCTEQLLSITLCRTFSCRFTESLLSGEPDMGQGSEASRRSPEASLRPPALLLPLGIVLAAFMLLAFHWHLHVAAPTTAGCFRERGMGVHTLTQNPKLLRSTEMTQCAQQPHADVEWIQGLEGQAGGAHTCNGFHRVCLDQGAVVLHDDSYVTNGTGFDLPTFEIGDLWVCPNIKCFSSTHFAGTKYDHYEFLNGTAYEKFVLQVVK